ncbi:hypothetical protein Q5752_005994 [Cryptotrichosporon argae]
MYRRNAKSGLDARLLSNDLFTYFALAYGLQRWWPAPFSAGQKAHADAFEAWVGAAWVDTQRRAAEIDMLGWGERFYDPANFPDLAAQLAKAGPKGVAAALKTMRPRRRRPRPS